MGRRHGKLRKACHVLGLACAQDGRRVPILNLGSKRHLHVGRVEQRDGCDAALTGADGRPALGDAVAQRGDSAHSRYDNPAFCHVDSLHRHAAVDGKNLSCYI